jgi:pimeloyl-ACP methyl ester carboxylesterase
MHKDIEFKTEDGITLRGWHYIPDGASGPVPTVVMSHGFSAVKEMYLDKYAEAFAAAGIGSIVYDNRNFGASDIQSIVATPVSLAVHSILQVVPIPPLALVLTMSLVETPLVSAVAYITLQLVVAQTSAVVLAIT